jgi:hypothetical protein
MSELLKTADMAAFLRYRESSCHMGNEVPWGIGRTERAFASREHRIDPINLTPSVRLIFWPVTASHGRSRSMTELDSQTGFSDDCGDFVIRVLNSPITPTVSAFFV